MSQNRVKRVQFIVKSHTGWWVFISWLDFLFWLHKVRSFCLLIFFHDSGANLQVDHYNHCKSREGFDTSIAPCILNIFINNKTKIRMEIVLIKGLGGDESWKIPEVKYFLALSLKESEFGIQKAIFYPVKAYQKPVATKKFRHIFLHLWGMEVEGILRRAKLSIFRFINNFVGHSKTF